MPNITKYIIAGFLGLLGLFYVVMPHSIHISSGIGLGLPHAVHLAIGVALIITAIIIFIAAKRS